MRNFVLLVCFACFGLSAQTDTVKVSLGLDPQQNAEMDYNKGLQALRNSEYESAADLFTKSLQVKPGFDQALANRAIVYSQLKRFAEAVTDINQALLLKPSAAYHFNKSLIYAAMAQKDSQEVALDACLALDPSNAEAAYYKGLLLYEKGDAEGAMAFYSKAIAAKPGYALALNDRGSLKRLKNDLPGALTDYEAASQADNSLPFVYNNIGTVYRMNKDYEKAIEAYTKALQLDKTYLLALNNRGVTQFERNELKLAQSDFEAMLSVDPKNSNAYNNLCSIAIRNEDFKKAKDLADRAIELNKSNGPAYYNRGIARQMLREDEGSCSDWKKAYELGVTSAKNVMYAACLEN